jgi:hypothetical protein
MLCPSLQCFAQAEKNVSFVNVHTHKEREKKNVILSFVACFEK